MKNYGVYMGIILVLLISGCGSQEDPEKGMQPSTEVKKESKGAKEAVQAKRKDVVLEHEKFVKETEDKLAEYDEEVRELWKKAFESAAAVKPQFQKEMVEIQKNLDAAKKNLAEWRSASGKAKGELKSRMAAAMTELEKAIQKTKSH